LHTHVQSGAPEGARSWFSICEELSRRFPRQDRL
jgi:hypothetical protein